MARDVDHPPYRKLGPEPALDGIRGVAVLLVLLWHFAPDILGHPLEWVKSGHLGVDLFFVLSGFLITALMLNEHNREGRISFPGFYRRRVFRLLPALVVFLTAHFVWTLLLNVPPDVKTPVVDLRNEIASVLSALFFSLNLLPMLGDFQATLGIGHLWSLAVEEQFYAIWPFLTAALLSRSRVPYQCVSVITAFLVAFSGYRFLWNELGDAQRWLSSLVSASAVFALLYTVRRRGWEIRALAVLTMLAIAVLMFRIGLYDRSWGVSLLLYASLPSRADSLIVGAALAYLWVNGSIPYRCHSAVSFIGWIIFGWLVAFNSDQALFYTWGWTLVALCGAAIIWGSLGSQGTFYGRLLTWPPLRAVGRVAYGLYLWHAFVFAAVRHGYGDESVLFKAILGLGITAGATMASWFLVERPMLAYKRARKTGRGKNRVACQAE